MNTITHKIGDTFVVNGAAANDDGTPLDLSGYTLAMEIRNGSTLVSTASIPASTTPNFTATVADTSAWPAALLVYDIKLSVAGVVMHTQTGNINAIRAVTQ